MSAVLIGSRVYKPDSQDSDFLANQEWMERFKTDHPTHEYEERPSTFGVYHIFKKPSINEIVEICVPRQGTVFHHILENGETILQTDGYVRAAYIGAQLYYIAPLHLLAALKKAHLILPHKWESHIEWGYII